MPPKSFRRDIEADEPERSFWFDTVPKWGPTVGVAIIAATIVATFVVVCVIGFGWVVPVLNNGYLVTNKATGALDYVISLADAPYAPMSRNLLNVRAEKPYDSLRQTVQMIPGLTARADTILQKIDTDLLISDKVWTILVRLVREVGIETLIDGAAIPAPTLSTDVPAEPTSGTPDAPVVGIPPISR